MQKVGPMNYQDIAKRCIAVRTAMTARTVSRLFDTYLRDAGLTNTQFTLLVATGAGNFESMSALGELLCIDRSTLSRNFKPLFDAGFVERVEGQKGRAIPLQLTEKGKEKLQEGYPYWQDAQDKVESAFDATTLSSGRNFLRALRNAAEID